MHIYKIVGRLRKQVDRRKEQKIKFEPRQVREDTSKDFEAAWMAGTRYATERRRNDKYPRSLLRLRCGKPHPVFETIQKLRDAYLRPGFEEVMNPVIIEEAEVKRQFGKEIYVDCKNSTVALPFKNSAFAFTVAVPLAAEDVKVAVTEACPAGILTGLSIVPIFVTNSTVTSSGTGIGIPFLSSILIVIY